MSTAPSAPLEPTQPTIVAPDVSRIEATELGELLQEPTTRDKVVIIDVRDTGTDGGFIKGAINIPKTRFEDDEFVDEFIAKHGSRSDQHLVFHCLNSNNRGPYCAGRVFDRLKTIEVDNPNVKIEKSRVCVLKGGFREFKETHGNDSKLIDPTELK